MADTFSKKQRSELMSRIRSKNTSIEKKIFSFLRKENIYFKKHYKGVLGSPDIALPRKKKAVFVDGDFWHGWKFVQTKHRLPPVYWRAKIESNIRRDKSRTQQLRRKGWKIMRIWEHDLKNKELETLNKIKEFLVSD